jgi:hypothetical protein
MQYEVRHGESTRFVQSGNPWSACLDTLRDEARDDTVQVSPFLVTPLPTGEAELKYLHS